MANGTDGLAKLDELIAGLIADWNIYSTLIAAALIFFGAYAVFSIKEPDVHPFLLARQSTEAPIRQSGESAAFRSLETPYGFPLKSGINIKDPDSPKWTSGRNGDLRDIWKTAVRGVTDASGTTTGRRARFFTVLGKNLIEHSLDDITKEINVIGTYIKEAHVATVAVSLADSVELLALIFAGAFYNFRIVIIPHNISSELVSKFVKKSQAQLLIAEAGALDLTILTKGNKQLKHVVWVAKQGSRHMDWNDVPEGIGGELEVSVWHELVKDKGDAVGSSVPNTDSKSPTPSIVTLWPASSAEDGDFVEYTPQSLVAGIGALQSSLPTLQRLTPDDLVLSIDSLALIYPLCWLMVALYSHSSVAFNSVAGENVDFALATVGVSPTAIITSSTTISEYHKQFMKPHTGLVSRISRWFQARSLDAGRMPSRNLFSQIASVGPTAELTLERLRLLVVSHRVDDEKADSLTFQQLTDFRIFTGARIVYALIAPGVAGAVTQTSIYDYRRESGPAHFGAPVSSVEVKLTGHAENTGLERAVEGELSVSGPAVVAGTTRFPVRARFREDNTLELLK